MHTNPYPVDSTFHACCNGIGKHAPHCVAPPAGATYVADWYDMQFGIDHVRRYFSGSSRVVERDGNDMSVEIYGTQGPDGDVTRHIMVVDGNTEAVELTSTHARQLGRALLAAADEADQMATYDDKAEVATA
jgi:hypothetical protein